MGGMTYVNRFDCSYAVALILLVSFIATAGLRTGCNNLRWDD